MSNNKWRYARKQALKKQSNNQVEKGFNKLIMIIWALKRRQLGLIPATLVVLLTLFIIITQSNASSATTSSVDHKRENQTNHFPKLTNQQQQQRRQVSLVNHNWR